MNRGAVAVALAVLYGWCAWIVPPWIGWAFAWTGLSAAWVALAYGTGRGRLLGKADAPRLAGWLLFPFLGSARLGVRAARRGGLVERDEVVPGLWVGGWPGPGPSDLAHLDCTAELPRVADPAAYRCVPMLDGAPMTERQLVDAIDQVREWRAEGRPVLVHCAYGQGRSVTVVCCVLVLEGVAADLDAAEARVKQVRPRARMTPGQREIARKTLRNARR